MPSPLDGPAVPSCYSVFDMRLRQEVLVINSLDARTNEVLRSFITVQASGCWHWHGATNLANKPCVLFRENGSFVFPGVALYRTFRKIPLSKRLAWLCDNPSCICPDHTVFEDASQPPELLALPPRSPRASKRVRDG